MPLLQRTVPLLLTSPSIHVGHHVEFLGAKGSRQEQTHSPGTVPVCNRHCAPDHSQSVFDRDITEVSSRGEATHGKRALMVAEPLDWFCSRMGIPYGTSKIDGNPRLYIATTFFYLSRSMSGSTSTYIESNSTRHLLHNYCTGLRYTVLRSPLRKRARQADKLDDTGLADTCEAR